MSYITVTYDNFEKEILKSEKTVLLDFWASWCGPCQMIAPVIEEIAVERADITVGKINVDNEPELASAFEITSIPTLVVMKDGKIAKQMVGFRSKSEILDELNI